MKFGLQVSLEQVITPFIAAKNYLQQQEPPFSIYVAGSKDLSDELQMEGIKIIEEANKRFDSYDYRTF